MPGVLHTALETVTHGENDVFPSLTPGHRHGVSRVPTMFEDCWVKRRMLFEGRTSPGRPFPDGRPCRFDEETSCNKVHATCAAVLRIGTWMDNSLGTLLFDRLKPPCVPTPDLTPSRGILPPPANHLNEVELKLRHPSNSLDITGKPKNMAGMEKMNSTCNARMLDLPWGLYNNEAMKDESKGVLDYLGMRRAVWTEPAKTVWGMAVHGKAGTFAFDSGSWHIRDYIYTIRQGNGLPDDYYVCDSRTHPSQCALIGGNLRHACAEWYDPRQCQMCEDKGDSLVCSLRGWNNKLLEWSRVPIYPRDLLGEMYRGEFRDVWALPAWATITIPKDALRHPVKEIPWYMTMRGEAMDAVEDWYRGSNTPQHALMAWIMGSSVPDVRLLVLGFGLEAAGHVPTTRQNTSTGQSRDTRHTKSGSYQKTATKEWKEKFRDFL